MNILIIEDDKMLRMALSHHFLEEGHMISAASNGKQALDLVEQTSHLDLIICDVLLPEISGPTFILMLKQKFPKKVPALIVISAVKDGENFLKSLGIPYDHFLPKPIDFNELGALASLTLSNGKA